MGYLPNATTSRKIYWNNHFLQTISPPPFDQCWWVCKLHRDHSADKLLTHNIDIKDGEGSLNRDIFKFFEGKP